MNQSLVEAHQDQLSTSARPRLFSPSSFLFLHPAQIGAPRLLLQWLLDYNFFTPFRDRKTEAQRGLSHSPRITWLMYCGAEAFRVCLIKGFHLSTLLLCDSRPRTQSHHITHWPRSVPSAPAAPPREPLPLPPLSSFSSGTLNQEGGIPYLPAPLALATRACSHLPSLPLSCCERRGWRVG